MRLSWRRAIFGFVPLVLIVAAVSSDRVMIGMPRARLQHYGRKISKKLQEKAVFAYVPCDAPFGKDEWVQGLDADTRSSRLVAGKHGYARHIIPGDWGLISVPMEYIEREETTMVAWLKFHEKEDTFQVTRWLKKSGSKLQVLCPYKWDPLVEITFPATDEFFHVAVVISNNPKLLQLYINGEVAAELAMENYYPLIERYSLDIGQRRWTPPADLVVDDFAFIRRVLPADEVREIATTRRSLAALYAPATHAKLRVAASVDNLCRRILKSLDMFWPGYFEGRITKTGLPEYGLLLSKKDRTYFNAYHSERIAHGLTDRGTSDRRSVDIVVDGVKYDARAELVHRPLTGDLAYSRKSYSIAVDPGADPSLAHPGFELTPIELMDPILMVLASRLAREHGVPVVPVVLTVLRINRSLEQLCVAYPRSCDPGYYRLDDSDQCLALLAELPLNPNEVVAEYRALARGLRPLFASDKRCPLSSRHWRVRTRNMATRIAAHLASDSGSQLDPLEKAAALMSERFFLGDNPAANLVVTDLSLKPLTTHGITTTFKSLTPDVIRDDGSISRPASAAQEGVVRVTVADAQRALTNDLRFVVQPTQLPAKVLHLRTGNEIGLEHRVSATARMFDRSGAPVCDWISVRTKYRGNAAVIEPKKYFSLRLDDSAVLVGERAYTHVNLTSSYLDPTFMKDKLTYDLFREFDGQDDLNYTPRCEYVEVALDGRYHGLYTISERVDGVSLGFDEPVNDAGERPALYKSLGRNSNFRVLSHGDYSQKVPGWKQMAYWKPYETFINLCGQSSDAEFARDFEKLVDLDNIIDFHLMLWFNNDQDGSKANIFIARDNKPGSRFFLIPWDNDKTFKKRGWQNNYLLKRLMANYPGYRERLTDRYHELRKGVLSTDALMSRIDGMATTLAPAYRRDHEVWGDEYYGQHVDNSYYLEALRTWIQNRLTDMDTVFPKNSNQGHDG
ncbi:MAG: CotH kinase family protein [Kiritimatiellae bacterium]|nr:CotH kinase family protein [Kiritimatiellia bacterium]